MGKPHYRMNIWLPKIYHAFLILLVTIVPATATLAEEAATQDSSVEVVTAPVTVDGKVLFSVRGISAFPASVRASQIAHRIEALAADDSFEATELKLSELDGNTMIAANNTRLMMVFDGDASLENIDKVVLANIYRELMQRAILDYRKARSFESLLRSAVLIVLSTLALAGFLWLGQFLVKRLDKLLDRTLRARLAGIESQSFNIVRANQLWSVLLALRKFLWLVAMVLAVFAYVEFTLSQLPWTKHLAQHVLSLVVEPLRTMADSILTTIPDLMFLVILFFVTSYFLKAIRLFFSGVDSGAIRIANFYPEWAWPTFRIVRVVVIAFALVVAFPYIPGSDSDAFKGISVFLGIVFSLGSSSIISNVIAGYSMIYRRAFKLGDRIGVEEHMGDVTKEGLLVTHLQTLKNEEIILPNSMLLNSSVTNYSTLAREGKLVLHTSVGIGYETPWRQVEAMLLEAAKRTKLIPAEPAPFVLQKSLGDFCVNYEINVYCDNAQAMSQIYSELHRHILDVFNEYGVAIMTPAYVADPPDAKLVAPENWYLAPAKKTDD